LSLKFVLLIFKQFLRMTKTVTTFDFDDIHILKVHTLTNRMAYNIAV